MTISPLPSDRNRRASPRKMIRGEATVVHGSTSKPAQAWDLGRDGMCLVSPRPIAPGTRCTITFHVPLGSERISVSATAKVVYSSYSAAGAFKIGTVFVDLADEVAQVLARFAAGS
ncbi:MAG TPA: PilZ domain-containing protein [Caldimonas sp.]|jgi:hypothetical protein